MRQVRSRGDLAAHVFESRTVLEAFKRRRKAFTGPRPLSFPPSLLAIPTPRFLPHSLCPNARSNILVMRSPAVVFSLVAVTALSPSLALGSPMQTRPTHVSKLSSNPVAARGLGFLHEVFARDEPPQPTPTSHPRLATVQGYKIGYASVIIFRAHILTLQCS